MLSWWTKKSLRSINIWNTITNMLPLCSVHQAPSYESNITLLAPFPTELAYLNMLYILEMVCTACSDHMQHTHWLQIHHTKYHMALQIFIIIDVFSSDRPSTVYMMVHWVLPVQHTNTALTLMSFWLHVPTKWFEHINNKRRNFQFHKHRVLYLVAIYIITLMFLQVYSLCFHTKLNWQWL